MSTTRLALGAAAILVAAAGCGSSGSGGSSSTAATSRSAAGTASSTTRSGADTPSRGPAPWPAPTSAMARARAAGLTPEVRESLTYHVHAHLDVFVNGKPVSVPAGIGINIRDPGVQHGDDGRGHMAYGGISGCATPCISPLHTHDVSGVLHTESPTPVPNRLGEFFIEWGVRLDARCVGGYCRPSTPVAIYVNGKRFSGDPRTILLTDRTEIAIVIGTPPAKIPKVADLSTA